MMVTFEFGGKSWSVTIQLKAKIPVNFRNSSSLRLWETLLSQRKKHVFSIYPLFLVWFSDIFLRFFSIFSPFWHPSMSLQKFWACNALDCLNFIQGLHSLVEIDFSKCRKCYLRDLYFNYFPRGACPPTPLEAHACGTHGCGFAVPKYQNVVSCIILYLQGTLKRINVRDLTLNGSWFLL